MSIKAPVASLVVWFTHYYWKQVAFFVRLLKFIDEGKWWKEIKRWCAETDAPMSLSTTFHLDMSSKNIRAVPSTNRAPVCVLPVSL